jgi:hypothetical protein
VGPEGSSARRGRGRVQRGTLATDSVRVGTDAVSTPCSLWRKLTQRRAKNRELDLRPERDRLFVPIDGSTPDGWGAPRSEGLEKPKY